MLSKFVWRGGTWFKASRSSGTRSPRHQRRLRFEMLDARLPLDSSAAALAANISPPVAQRPADDLGGFNFNVTGNTLTVQGTGADNVEIDVASGIIYGYVDGQYVGLYVVGTGTSSDGNANDADISTINFNGGGGDEQATFKDETDNFTATLGSGSATFTNTTLGADNTGLTINVTNCPDQFYYGSIGSSVSFSDSTDTAGTNSFVAATDYCEMDYGADLHAETLVFGPENVTASSSNPQQDTAYFYESEPIATFNATPGTATANFTDDNGNAVVQVANNFGHVLAVGGGSASDVADLQGSVAGTNTYCATQFYSWMDNANSTTGATTYFNITEFFGTTTGTSNSKGNDFDYLYAPAGTSVEFDNSGLADNGGLISGEMFAGGSSTAVYTAVGFATTLAVGNSNSIDSATLYAHPGQSSGFTTYDGFVAGGSYGLLTESTSSILNIPTTTVTTSATEFDDVTVINSSESGTGTEYLNSYNYNLQFQGSWVKEPGSM